VRAGAGTRGAAAGAAAASRMGGSGADMPAKRAAQGTGGTPAPQVGTMTSGTGVKAMKPNTSPSMMQSAKGTGRGQGARQLHKSAP
jgi:hypothetical protein